MGHLAPSAPSVSAQPPPSGLYGTDSPPPAARTQAKERKATTPPWRSRPVPSAPDSPRLPCVTSGATSADGRLETIPCLQSLRRLFVVSVCDGIGSIFVALTSLGVGFSAIAAEKEAHLRALVHDHFPAVTPWADMQKLQLQDLVKLLPQGTDSILLNGGPPCQPSSGLGSQAGFEDPRAQPLVHFFRLRDEL